MKALRRQIKFAPAPGTRPVPKHPTVANGKGVTLTTGEPLNRIVTQQDQDEKDEQKRREALRDLVESWMDRLQLITVITTFFAATEASMFSIAAPSSDGVPLPVIAQIANIGILGGLIIHTSAAIISFLAAFFLIRYKLEIATDEEKQAEGEKETVEMVDSPTSISSRDMEKAEYEPPSRGRKRNSRIPSSHSTDPIPGPVRIHSGSQQKPVWSCNPHLVQVGPFQGGEPPTNLLARFHALCIFLTALGFVLALTGIVCFAWDRLPLSVGISSSFFMALCIFSVGFVVISPYPPEGTRSSLIYFMDGW